MFYLILDGLEVVACILWRLLLVILLKFFSRSHSELGQVLRICPGSLLNQMNHSLCYPCPFARLIAVIWHPDVLFCCSSCGEAVLFWKLWGQGGHCWSALHVVSRGAFFSFVWGRADWLAVEGLNPFFFSQREVVATAGRRSYLPPSLPPFSWDSLQLFRVCIIPYKIRPPRFPHNSYRFIHIACDNYKVI